MPFKLVFNFSPSVVVHGTAEFGVTSIRKKFYIWDVCAASYNLHVKVISMKAKAILTLALLSLAVASYGQQGSPWDRWSWLMGEWVGEGGGQPGQGGGTFSFTLDLDKHIIVRKSHSEYPAKDGKPAIIHNDLMVVYLDYAGNPSKAIYFDNEGHTINYTVAYTDQSIVLTSDKIPSMPLFRLTYTLLNNGMVDTKFEMSQDGQTYMTYIEGKSKKVE